MSKILSHERLFFSVLSPAHWACIQSSFWSNGTCVAPKNHLWLFICVPFFYLHLNVVVDCWFPYMDLCLIEILFKFYYSHSENGNEVGNWRNHSFSFHFESHSKHIKHSIGFSWTTIWQLFRIVDQANRWCVLKWEEKDNSYWKVCCRQFLIIFSMRNRKALSGLA